MNMEPVFCCARCHGLAIMINGMPLATIAKVPSVVTLMSSMSVYVNFVTVEVYAAVWRHRLGSIQLHRQCIGYAQAAASCGAHVFWKLFSLY